MKMEEAKKLAKEMTYYDMVLWRVESEMSNAFYSVHKERLDNLAFLINSHKQDLENGENDGYSIRATK